jgi:hypothetical protein
MVVTRSAILDFHGTLSGARWQLAEVASEERDREGVRATARQITGGPEPVLAIYVDGGGIRKKVGAAAVAPGLNAHGQAYLGKETTATVYAVELPGVMIGVEMATRSNRGRAVIFRQSTQCSGL